MIRLSPAVLHVYVASTAALDTAEHKEQMSADDAEPSTLKYPSAQLLTRLLTAVLHVYVAPSTAPSTAVHATHTSAVPLESFQKPSAQTLTRLSVALLQVYVAPSAACDTVLQALQVCELDEYVWKPLAHVPDPQPDDSALVQDSQLDTDGTSDMSLHSVATPPPDTKYPEDAV